MGRKSDWTSRKRGDARPLTALELERLLADWRECEQRLERMPAGATRDALDADCARLADAYAAAVKARAARDQD